MADKTTSKFRRDERRGVLTRIPSAIAEVLPEEGELEWEIDGEQDALVVRVVETARKPMKLGKAKAANG